MKKTLDKLRAVVWLACALTLMLPALLAVAVRGIVKWVTLPIRYTTARVLRELILATMDALCVRREDLDDECRDMLKEVDDALNVKSWL